MGGDRALVPYTLPTTCETSNWAVIDRRPRLSSLTVLDGKAIDEIVSLASSSESTNQLTNQQQRQAADCFEDGEDGWSLGNPTTSRTQQPTPILYWYNGEVLWSCGPNRGCFREEPGGKDDTLATAGEDWWPYTVNPFLLFSPGPFWGPIQDRAMVRHILQPKLAMCHHI